MDLRAGLVLLMVLGVTFEMGRWWGKIEQRNTYLPLLRQARIEKARAERHAAMKGANRGC